MLNVFPWKIPSIHPLIGWLFCLWFIPKCCRCVIKQNWRNTKSRPNINYSTCQNEEITQPRFLPGPDIKIGGKAGWPLRGFTKASVAVLVSATTSKPPKRDVRGGWVWDASVNGRAPEACAAKLSRAAPSRRQKWQMARTPEIQKTNETPMTRKKKYRVPKMQWFWWSSSHVWGWKEQIWLKPRRFVVWPLLRMTQKIGRNMSNIVKPIQNHVNVSCWTVGPSNI